MKRGCVGGMDVRSSYPSGMRAFRATRSDDQLLNLDKLWLSVRPATGKQKKCVSKIESGIEPRFREESDLPHVTRMDTVNSRGRSLPQLIFTTEDIRFTAEIVKHLKDSLSPIKRPKVYLNPDSMSVYIETILIGDCSQVRKHLGDLNIRFG
jgi:hypothetical protein